MGAAARAHVLRHHTHAALVAHMLAAAGLDPARFDLAERRADQSAFSGGTGALHACAPQTSSMAPSGRQN